VTTRAQILVRGIVQGVGFRPFVYSNASRNALTGRVRNNASGVLIDVEGNAADIEQFVREIEANPELQGTLDLIASGFFSPGRPDDAKQVIERLLSDAEPYLVLADYTAYAEAQDRVDALYALEDQWSHKAVINCLNMGYFSSDRSIREYADRIWSVKPVI